MDPKPGLTPVCSEDRQGRGRHRARFSSSGQGQRVILNRDSPCHGHPSGGEESLSDHGPLGDAGLFLTHSGGGQPSGVVGEGYGRLFQIRSGGLQRRQGRVDFRIVGVEVGAENLVFGFPLVQLIIGRVIARHSINSSLFELVRY